MRCSSWPPIRQQLVTPLLKGQFVTNLLQTACTDLVMLLKWKRTCQVHSSSCHTQACHLRAIAPYMFCQDCKANWGTLHIVSFEDQHTKRLLSYQWLPARGPGSIFPFACTSHAVSPRSGLVKLLALSNFPAFVFYDPCCFSLCDTLCHRCFI